MDDKQPEVRELRLEINGLKQQVARLEATLTKRDAEISACENLAKSIFTQTDQVLLVCDSRGRITRASQAARRLAGRDLLGHYFHEALVLKVEAAETVGKKRAKLNGDPLAAALAGEVRQGLEATLRREDGQVFHLRMNAAPIYEAQGQVSGTLIAFHDLTDLKESERQRQDLWEEVEAQSEKLAVDNEELTVQAEELRVQNEELQAVTLRLEVQREELERTTEELEAERALLRTVLEQMPGGVIIAAAPSGKFLLVNRQMSKILGHPLSLEDSLKNYAHYQFLHPDGWPLPPGEYPLVRALEAGKATKEAEFDLVRDDGAIRTLRVSANPIRDRLGRIIAGVGTYADITEQKQAQEALVRAKEEWEMTFDAVPDLIAILDTGHRIVRVNRTMAEVLGVSPQDLEGRACHEIIHNSPGPPAFCPHSRLLVDGQEHVAEVHELGRDFLVSASPLTDEQGDIWGSVHVARDITARKQAEEEIRMAHDKLQALIQASPLAIISLDTQGRVTSWNPAATRMFGWREDEVLGQPLPTVPEAEQEQLQELMQRQLTGEGLVAVELRRRKRDGTPLIVRLSSGALRDAEGQITGFTGFLEDFTVQKEMEKALRESQQDLNRAQAVAQTGSWRMNLRRNELLWSDETYRIFGLPLGTPMTYERFMAAVHPEDREYVDLEWSAALAGEAYDIEHRIVVGDAVKWVREKAEMEFDPQGVLMGGFGTVQDITGRKQAEEALRRSNQRLDLLVATASELLASPSPQQVVDSLCTKVMAFLDCDAFFNFVVDESAGRLHLNACAGIPAEEAEKIEWLDYGVAVCGCAALEGCRIVTEHIQTTPDPRTELVKSYGIQAYACHPLISQGRVLGTLSFGTRTRSSFSDDDLALMKTVADQVAIAMDRKLAEEALRASEARERARAAELQAVFDAAPTLIWLAHDPECRMITGNRAAYEILRLPIGSNASMTALQEELTEHFKVMKDSREISPEELPVQRAAALGETAQNYELDLVFEDGKVRHLLGDAVPLLDEDGRPRGAVGAFIDVTARKEAEAALKRAHDELEERVAARTAELKSTVEQLVWEVEERQRIEASLRESEAIFRGIFDQSPVGVFMAGLDYRYNRVNEAFCQLTGYSEGELFSLGFPEITHPDDLEEDVAIAQLLAAGDIEQYDKEKRYLRKDGQATWVRLTLRAVSDADGRLRHYLGIVQDINARKQAEAALAVEKQRLASLLEHIPAYVVLLKPDYTMPFANREFIRRFGDPEARPCYEFLFGLSEPCEDCKSFEPFHTRAPVTWEWAGPDGNTYQIYDYPFTDIDGSPLILEMGVDITARKEAEDQLRRQTDILEAINRVFRESLSCDTEGKLGRICLAMAEELTGSQHGFICEVNPEGKLDALAFSDLGWDVCKMAAGEPAAQKEVTVQGLNLRVIKEGCSLMVNEPGSHPEAAGFLEGQPPITSFLATPLKMAGRVIGFIGLANKAGGYAETDQAALEMLARAIVEVLMRFRAEKKAASTSRLYRLVSKVNEAIVRAEDQDVLFQQVCRIAVEEGLFRMAWIGLADRKSQLIKAVAQYGLEEGYLERVKISIQKGAESLGPTGTAVRQGRYDVCNDIKENSRMAPWQEQALKRGYRSSGAFPLRVGSRVVGALTIYSGERGFFTAEEIGLLDALAQDVSFAMESFDRETRRRQAAEALQESEERLRLLAAQLIKAQEAERRRMAIELHDDLGQSLMVLKMQVREIAKLLPADLQPTKELSIQVLDYIDGVVENVRRLSRDLRPSILEDLGLPLALKQLLENFHKYHEIEFSLDLEDIQGLLMPEQEILIYRIFQESLTNIAKHAQASQVKVAIRKGDESIYFSVEDNGRGFDLEEFRAGGLSRQGLGLASMEERVRMLDGVLKIWSQARQGTRITFHVPLQQP
jgi:PAS domain S-box-containing protein